MTREHIASISIGSSTSTQLSDFSRSVPQAPSRVFLSFGIGCVSSQVVCHLIKGYHEVRFLDPGPSNGARNASLGSCVGTGTFVFVGSQVFGRVWHVMILIVFLFFLVHCDSRSVWLRPCSSADGTRSGLIRMNATRLPTPTRVSTCES